uniref:Uncharacterized protein n=1 Tax=Panagrolaimus sp. ES5 TaxID=591445 RepID=A0AC34FJX5_9BILA
MRLSTTYYSLFSTFDFPNYEEFRASAYRQIFDLPESIVFYMAKNPPSSEIHRKMIQCCKYFFIKNPILHFHCLHFDGENGWKTCINENCLGPKNAEYQKIDLDMDKIQSKIWIDFDLSLFSSNPAFASSLIPKLYNGNVKSLQIYEQKISFNDLLFFSKEMKQIVLDGSTVVYQNGNEVPYEIILFFLPKLRNFIVDRYSKNAASNVFYDFSNTVKELLRIPNFKNLTGIVFYGVTESFDVTAFYNYFKDMKDVRASLKYYGLLSEEYTEKLQSITDEILEGEYSKNYFPFYIVFNGQFRQNKLKLLYNKYW